MQKFRNFITASRSMIYMFWVLTITWTFVVAGLIAWSRIQHRQATRELVINEARAHFNKDQAFRFWGNAHGGVYVPIDEHTPPNPHLRQIPERDIETPAGLQLTLMNPAYMVRQMNEDYSDLYNVAGRITSLKPLRPENSPDDWERKALQAFELGVAEVMEFTEIEGEPYLRLMSPMITQEGCLKCHAHQGYQEGDVRGGVGVSVSMAAALIQEQRAATTETLSLGLIWLLGVGGIRVATHGFERRDEQRNRAEKALHKSHFHLEETLRKLRDTQEQIMQQERLAAVGQLAAGIAHDFNNILASIILYTEMSLLTGKPNPEIREWLEVIAEQADNGKELVQQILDFGRRALVRSRPLDMDSFLADVVKLLKRTLPESVQVELTSEPGEHAINADATRIQQVIVNLALNARDAMPNGGKLHISLSLIEGEAFNSIESDRIVEGKWIRVIVSDTGMGIAPDILPHIFEPFFTTKAPLGHGLGLAQAYGIVKQHEGHIEVQSEIGSGTTFKLYWPAIIATQADVKSKAQSGTARGEGQTILVVEDDETIRLALKEVLEMLGYQVLEASEGHRALEICEEKESDIALMLSDLVMPSMGGLEIARELEVRNMAIKVLILTGYLFDEELKKNAPQNVVDWVMKPLSLQKLGEVVALALVEE